MAVVSWPFFVVATIVIAIIIAVDIRRHGPIKPSIFEWIWTSALSGAASSGAIVGIAAVLSLFSHPASTKPQSWFVEKSSMQQTGGTPNANYDEVWTPVRGPYLRESACIATLENPRTGDRIQPDLDCRLDDNNLTRLLLNGTL